MKAKNMQDITLKRSFLMRLEKHLKRQVTSHSPESKIIVHSDQIQFQRFISLALADKSK